MNKYTRGNVIKIPVTVVDSATPTPQPVDPAQPFAEFFGADGTLHLPTVTRDGLGLYHYLIDTALLPLTPSQVCKRRFWAPDGDPGQCAVEGAFQVVSIGPFSP